MDGSRFSASSAAEDSESFSWPKTRSWAGTVALKVPRVEVLSQSEGWRRFLREARTASRLDHPNLVPLLEAGAIGPVGYIVSAFVEGPTLERCLKDAQQRRAGPVQRSRWSRRSPMPSSTCTSGAFSIATSSPPIS